MVKRSIHFCLGLSLLIFSGCGGGNSMLLPVDVKYFIVPERSILSENTRFSELLDEYRYIILEATDESLFSSIYKAYIYRGYIYILDKRNQNKILVFNLDDGKFIMGIGRQGRGPNEYVDLGNFTLDKSKGNVLILDELRNKVLIYDADSGIFKSYFDLDFTARNIEYIDENTLAYAGGGQYMDRLRLTDMEGKEQRSYVASDDKNWVVPINSFSRGTDSEVVFKTYLSDTLYTVTPQGPIVSRIVDFGADALDWKKFMSYSKSERNNIETYLGEYRANMKYYSETDNHIWFIFSNKGAPCCTVYNKNSSDTYNYSMFTPNDIVFDKFAPLIVASDEGFFIGQNDAFSIVENIGQSVSTDIPENIRNLSTYDNPVITLVKFKK